MPRSGRAKLLFLGCVLALLAGCASTEEYRAMPSPQAGPAKPPGIYHKVLPGQTLWQIAQSYGVSIKDIIDVNKIPNGGSLEAGQLLLIPGAHAPKNLAEHTEDANRNQFIWPVKGKVVVYFDDALGLGIVSRGIDIQAQSGDTIQAAREGDVVLADYLSGYGQTVMIDHKDGFISVYARNSRLYVKLGEHVYKGDSIAQVGPLGSKVQEHFEIRRGGQATNPLYYLP